MGQTSSLICVAGQALRYSGVSELKQRSRAESRKSHGSRVSPPSRAPLKLAHAYLSRDSPFQTMIV